MGSVLVVEADPGTSAAWSRALGSAGHEVLAIVDVRDAMRLISEGGLDVIVLDTCDAHDHRNGLLEFVRALERLPDAPPLILVSGSPTAPELSARIGAAGFVPKPCLPSELVDEVQRIAFASRSLRPSIPLHFDPAESGQLARGTGDVDLNALPRHRSTIPRAQTPRAPIAAVLVKEFMADEFDDEPTGPIQRRPELLG